MLHIHCIGLTLLTVILWQSNGIHAKPSLDIDANDIQCDICMGAVSLGKLFLVSPIMDSIKKMLVEKLCTLPGIMTRRCMNWGYHQIDEVVVHFLKQKSSKPLCKKCQLTMGYLQSTIINKIENQTTASWIEAMCKLTGSYSITCSALITEYVWNAAEVIHSTNSTSFCRLESLCPTLSRMWICQTQKKQLITN